MVAGGIVWRTLRIRKGGKGAENKKSEGAW